MENENKNRIMTGIVTVLMLMSSVASAHGDLGRHGPQAKLGHNNFIAEQTQATNNLSC